ncbi:MAG: T9SS type A sorting domain-containing protein [Bacteroidales bacterium]|nr:T9SS type A sorting domain-containing protein [Bacteroidales bacterium]
MKIKFLVIVLLLISQILHAQLVINAGDNKHRCTADSSVQFGSNPTAIGGVEPYVYQWSMNPMEYVSQHILYASALLDDTTKANPILKYGGQLDSVTFFLKVTDAIGTECFDTVTLTTSYFNTTMSDCYKYTISQDDSVYLDKGANIGGGWGNIVYSWTPTIGLNDSNLVSGFWAKPEVSTSYTATIIDVKGCRFTAQTPTYCITVNPLYIATNSVRSVNIYPNPAQKELNVESVSEIENINIYDMYGREIKDITFENGRIYIDNLAKGIYLLKISSRQSAVYYYRFVKI